jgi:hypothetical protein
MKLTYCIQQLNKQILDEEIQIINFISITKSHQVCHQALKLCRTKQIIYFIRPFFKI